MHEAVDQCVASASWRVYSLLRTRRFHTDAELINLFKAHVLSFIEYRNCAISHASTSVLAPLDDVLTRFLNSLHINALQALVYFNLAPLHTRRDIGMLGVIHRSVLGLGPSCFSRFFRPSPAPPPSRRRRYHCHHLEEPPFTAPDYVLHSAIGAVRIYNLLPQFVVRARTVSRFQSRLQSLLRARAAQCSDWDMTFSSRIPIASHPLRANPDWRG